MTDTVEATGADITGKVARGATLMVLLRLAMRLVSVVSQLVLVRLLSPGDFGLVTGAAAALTILDGLTETSMSMALVQMAAPELVHYQSAWTLVVLRGALLAAGVWASAPVMASFLHDGRVTAIVHVLAIAPLVQGLESAGMVRLQRELQFGRFFYYQLAGKVVGAAIALPLAVLYHNYWALVLGGLASRLVVIPLSYVIAPFRPRLSFRHAPALLHFSKWLLLNNVLTMADNFMMPMTLGRVGTVRDIGLFQVSYDLAALPASEIAAPIRRPMHAGYARLAHDPPRLRAQVLDGLGLVVLLIVPLSVGIAVTAGRSVPVVLGPHWLAATSALALAAIYTLFDAIGHFSGGIYLVLNAQRRYVGIMAGCLALRLALVVPAAVLGGLNAAMAMMALTAVVNAYCWFAALRPLLGLGWRALADVTGRSFLAAAVMAAAVMAADQVLPTAKGVVGMIAGLGGLCALGAVVHIGTQAVLWRLAGVPAGPEAVVVFRCGRWRERLSVTGLAPQPDH
jgi:O-antigen/teichoic acid export membrane protein